MNGLDRQETRHTLARGQRVFTEVFGEPARGLSRTGLAARTCVSMTRTPWDHVLGLLLAPVAVRPNRAARDLDLGLWSLGLARPHRSRIGWCLSR